MMALVEASRAADCPYAIALVASAAALLIFFWLRRVDAGNGWR